MQVTHPTTLVAFLTTAVPDMKRSTCKDRLRDGAVFVNGVVEHKATRALVAGDVVELRTKSARAAIGQTLQKGAGPVVTVLHVDDDIVVVDKPSGLLTVGAGSGGDTVLKQLGPRLERAGGGRLFPCHRLDQGTSGVLLLPRTKAVQDFYFEHWGQTEKTYVAVVAGVVAADAGTVDVGLIEDPVTLAVRVSTSPEARAARSHYRVLRRGRDTTLVEVRIDTGRKHQIRVHMLHLGHAVVGDDRYGARRAPRLCLHARELTFPHVRTQQRMTFQAAVPPLFDTLVP
jgi:23S rRNA pseudouridine1911/1915/1917 synthase